MLQTYRITTITLYKTTKNNNKIYVNMYKKIVTTKSNKSSGQQPKL